MIIQLFTIHELTNDVIGIWLNNNHYDLVLNFSKFIDGNSRKIICMWCMKQKRENHICTLPSMTVHVTYHHQLFVYAIYTLKTGLAWRITIVIVVLNLTKSIVLVNFSNTVINAK